MSETYLHALQIGGVTLENNVLMAPMAGISDLPFRLLCSEQGAGLVTMEMIRVGSITPSKDYPPFHKIWNRKRKPSGQGRRKT